MKVAIERINATLPLDESAMKTVTDKREQPRVAALADAGRKRPRAGRSHSDRYKAPLEGLRARGWFDCLQRSS